MISMDHDLGGLPDPDADAQFYKGVAVKRLIAWVIDFVIILLLALGAVVATLGLGSFIFPLLLLLIHLAYRIYMLTAKSATAGMLLTGIEIRNKDGDRLTAQEAIWHSCLFTLVMMIIFAQVLGILMMMLGRRGQGLHDYFLGTTAINRPEA